MKTWWRRLGWPTLALCVVLLLAVAFAVGVLLSHSDRPPSTGERPGELAGSAGSDAADSDHGLIVFDGCSLVDDAGVPRAARMPEQVMALLPPDLAMRNLGVGGQTTGMMAADAAVEVDPLFSEARDHNVLVVWEGTNDLAYGTTPPLNAAQAYRNLAAYCRARRKAGFTVVVCTVLPRQGSARFSVARDALNAELRTHWRRFADALADVAADPTVGPAGAELDTAYYRDTVHLTPAGYGIVARVIAAAVRRVL